MRDPARTGQPSTPPNGKQLLKVAQDLLQQAVERLVFYGSQFLDARDIGDMPIKKVVQVCHSLQIRKQFAGEFFCGPVSGLLRGICHMYSDVVNR